MQGVGGVEAPPGLGLLALLQLGSVRKARDGETGPLSLATASQAFAHGEQRKEQGKKQHPRYWGALLPQVRPYSLEL